MERKTGHSVVMMFVKKDQVLLETRPPYSSFANHRLFVGGHVEKNELHDPVLTLIREAKEELGVVPEVFEPLPLKEPIFGETGQFLHPFIVRQWSGQIPPEILDKNNPVLWVEIDTFDSSIESMRKLTAALKNYLFKNHDTSIA